MDINVRIAGEAGQGVQTTGDLLVNALSDSGLHVFSTQSYLSRIRGGLNWYDVRFADRELWSGREDVDVLVALTPEVLEAQRGVLVEGGVAFLNADEADGAFAIDFTKAAKEAGGSAIMANTVAAGAVYEVLGYDIETLVAYLKVEFEKKGGDVIDKNAACARRGAELAREKEAPKVKSPKPPGAPKTAWSGVDAVGLSAAASGIKFCASYPMTPSTGVFQFLADKGDQYGIIVEQAEDEIAAINMVCGATYAGVPAMTTTSGGGFALMAEGLSLAGMLELPAVILLGMRPAPATGMPTRTAQEDLKFAINAGHGEFARAVFAPGSIQEAFDLTRRAIETAHRYQTPVIIMTDQFLADLRKNVPDLDGSYRPIDRHVLENPPEGYQRYELTENGVSPRAIPGSGAFVVVDSDEHWTDGHITEDLHMRAMMVEKRLRKLDGLRDEALGPNWYGPEDARHVLVCWGSTHGPCHEAVDILLAEGASVAMMHYSQVWPINVEVSRELLDRAKRERITCIEGNARGQFAGVLREEGVLPEANLFTKYDGMPFTGAQIAGRIRNG